MDQPQNKTWQDMSCECQPMPKLAFWSPPPARSTQSDISYVQNNKNPSRDRIITSPFLWLDWNLNHQLKLVNNNWIGKGARSKYCFDVAAAVSSRMNEQKIQTISRHLCSGPIDPPNEHGHGDQTDSSIISNEDAKVFNSKIGVKSRRRRRRRRHHRWKSKLAMVKNNKIGCRKKQHTPLMQEQKPILKGNQSNLLTFKKKAFIDLVLPELQK